jgi:hypothetical protein
VLKSRSLRDVSFVLVSTLAFVLLLAAPALGAAPIPTPIPTPTVQTGIGNWQAIDGKPLEYIFQYSGLDRPVQIMLGADPANSVRFDVYTDDQWRALGAGGRGIEPVGRGTPNSYVAGDLSWELESPSGGLYHVQVSNNGSGDARFWIDKAGSGTSGLTPVSRPYVPATAVPAARPAAVVAPKATVAVAAKVVVTPTLSARTVSTVTVASKVAATPAPVKPAVAPKPAVAATVAPPRWGFDNWQAIDGQPLEYTFWYQGQNKPANILLGMDPANSVRFDVYTDDEWRALGGGDQTVKQVGAGTPNADEPGDLFYQLQSPSQGLYHVQVSSNGTGNARYWITTAGNGTDGLTAISPAFVPATPAAKTK